jgi:hypothetical protein
MAFFIEEKKMVEDAVFIHEKQLKSPVSRILETTPTFVTYYHLNPDVTTTDGGFIDVSSIIGFRSPLRFNKIDSFPLYGIEQIILQLQDTDQGLDSSYEGEATIVPGSIKPLENDFFIIPYLREPYMFRVTEIMYDNIMPDNYYKIGFKLEYIDDDKIENIEKQVHENYTCLLENIGTESNCIIQTDSKEKLDKIEAMYDDMASTYKSIFYNERHNCFLGEIGCGQFLYDPLQTEFINEHQLFNKKHDLQCLMLTDQFTDTKRRIKYERSIYRFIERRNPALVKSFSYDMFAGINNRETSFYRWMDRHIYILDNPAMLSDMAKPILSDEFIDAIANNYETMSEHAELIKRFVRNEKISINEIPLTLHEELLTLDGNMEVFFFTPIIMYIIKTIVNDFLNVKK